MMIPDTFDEITPIWLTNILHKAGVLRKAQITSVRCGEAAGGLAVTGLVSRLHLTMDRTEDGAPASIVAKIRNPSFTGSSETYEREVRFYRELASAITLPIPHCYYAAFQDGRLVLLLEDLTDVRPGHPLTGCDFRQARAVLTGMGRLHGHWWESSSLS